MKALLIPVKTFEAGLIKEEKYQELKQNILQEYNLSHIGI